jgi:hypothetical protein
MNLNIFVKFIDYCHNFYGPEGIYPMGATHADIRTATLELFLDPDGLDFVGDSVDRELVRDYLIDNMGYKFP